MAISIAVITACHQQRPSTARDANHLFTEHCWWSVNRSLLPPDSVAEHFAHAYTTIGFTNAEWKHLADTAWADAGPTPIRPEEPGVAYRAWAVAYRVADSTRYRYFVASIGREPRSTIPLCISIANRAALHGVQLPQPTGEETLSVWRRRPS
ncbi:MAG: hypothetical protein M3Y64_06975 [Gemmatimonadota bacterium]|nr:hypothetical protein [Gemmatimonadota bacterium]